MKHKAVVFLFFSFLFYSSSGFAQLSSVDSLFSEAAKYKKHQDTLIEIYTHILQLDPYNDRAFHERGEVFYNRWKKAKGKDEVAYEKALYDFNSAILLNEKHPPSFFLRSILHSHAAELELSIEDLSKAIRLDNTNHYYYARRGYVYKEMENYQLAETNFDMAIELVGQKYYNPDQRKILTSLYRDKAFSLAKLEKYRKALRAINRAIDFGGLFDYESLLYKGNIYAEMGKYTKALKMYDFIAERSHDFLQVYLHRGKVFYALDQKEKAYADWERMLKGGLKADLKKISVKPGF